MPSFSLHKKPSSPSLGQLKDREVRVVDTNNVIEAAYVKRTIGSGSLATVRREGNKTTAAHLVSDFIRGRTVDVERDKNTTKVTDAKGHHNEYIADEEFDRLREAFGAIKAEDIDGFSVRMLRRMVKNFSKIVPHHAMSAPEDEIDEMKEDELRKALRFIIKTVDGHLQR